MLAPPVLFAERRVVDRGGQEAAAQGRIGDVPDAERGAGIEEPTLGVTRPQRILGLERRQRMRLVCALQGLDRTFGNAEMADLALLLQPRHRAHRVLDRHVRIDAVDVVEVDALDIEPFQARLARAFHIIGRAAHAAAAIGRADLAEFRREHDLVAAALDRSAEQLLVAAVAVSIGTVDEVDAKLGRAMHRRNRFGLARLAIDRRHAHAAEAHRRHFESAQLTPLHPLLPRSGARLEQPPREIMPVHVPGAVAGCGFHASMRACARASSSFESLPPTSSSSRSAPGRCGSLSG